MITTSSAPCDDSYTAVRDVSNSTMLYRNLRISDWPASLKSLDENPLEASIWTLDHQSKWKMLPLHAAILYGAPSHVTAEILKAYPNAARETDLQGRLPIHLAASSAAAISADGKRIVNDLVRVYPDSLWVADGSGRTAMELVRVLQRQNDDEGSAGQSQQQQRRRRRRQRLRQRQPAKEQIQQQQEHYDSLYDLLSHGIAPDISIPHAVSTESSNSSSSSSLKTTMKEMFSKKEGKSDHRGSVDRLKPVEQRKSFEHNMKYIHSWKINGKSDDKLGPKLHGEQAEDTSLIVHSSDRGDALVRCDDEVVCYDEITYGYSGSMEKEEESVLTKVTNISNSAASATFKAKEKDRFSKRPPSSVGFSSRSKRTKKGPFMDLVSIGGSMSFESILSSYSKEEERSHVPTKCDCKTCESAAAITKEMGDLKRALLASDLVRPTLLFDYLVASDWDNVVSRIQVAPSEVKAWARKEVHGEMVIDVLPLHAAIVLGAPSDLIVALLNSFPTGAGEIDGNRSFPIHLVASCFTSIGRGDLVVDHLLKAFRSGKQAADAKGRTPGDIISIMSTSREHSKNQMSCEAKLATVGQVPSESTITVTKTFEDDAAFAYLVEKAMTNLDMPLKYQHKFLRQASSQGIETIDQLVMAGDEVLDTLFSEKQLTAELRRILPSFIEG